MQHRSSAAGRVRRQLGLAVVALACLGLVVVAAIFGPVATRGGAALAPVEEEAATRAHGAEELELVSGAPRAAVHGEERTGERVQVLELFARVAACEHALVEGAGTAAAWDVTPRVELERTIADLLETDGVLASAFDAIVLARPADEEPERTRFVRYGAVRACYWIAVFRANAGDNVEVADFVRRASDAVVAAELEVARLLADNATLVIEEHACARSREALDHALELRLMHPERAELVDRLLLALAIDLEEGDRHSLARWLLSDPRDAAAVAEGLTQLFENGDTWLALALASEGFELGDRAVRMAIADAVAKAAPCDLAIAFGLERADALGGAHTVWFKIGSRPEGSDALLGAYGDLRSADSDPKERCFVVSGMLDADPEGLRWIASDDPSDAVAAQALLVLTASDRAHTQADYEAVTNLALRARGDDLGKALWSVANLLDDTSRSSNAARRERLLDDLEGAVLDTARPIAERQAVLAALVPYLEPGAAEWLGAALGG